MQPRNIEPNFQAYVQDFRAILSQNFHTSARGKLWLDRPLPTPW